MAPTVSATAGSLHIGPAFLQRPLEPVAIALRVVEERVELRSARRLRRGAAGRARTAAGWGRGRAARKATPTPAICGVRSRPCRSCSSKASVSGRAAVDGGGDAVDGHLESAQLAVDHVGRAIRFGARLVAGGRHRVPQRSPVIDAQHHRRDRADEAEGADDEARGIEGRLEKRGAIRPPEALRLCPPWRRPRTSARASSGSSSRTAAWTSPPSSMAGWSR